MLERGSAFAGRAGDAGNTMAAAAAVTLDELRRAQWVTLEPRHGLLLGIIAMATAENGNNRQKQRGQQKSRD